MKEKNKKNTILITILILLLIVVGYATLTTQLDIKGTTTIKNNNFSIIFTNMVEKEGSVTANTPAKIDGDGSTSISFDADLESPGDYYGFSVDVKNTGQLDAMVETVSMTNLTDTQKKYLNFSIVDEYGFEVNEKDLLKRGASRTINVLIEYKKDLTEYPSSSQERISLTFDIKYVEADETAVDLTTYTWENKTAVFVGDSITAGVGTTKIYYEYLDEEYNFKSTTAKGIGGSAISVTSDYGTSNTPLINRYTAIPDADLITVFMGTNDYGHETPLGTISDTTDISFYGALNVIVPALKAAHPNSRIVFITPLHRYGFGTSKILGTAFTYDNIPNGAGATLEDYVNAIKEVCANNEIPVIDLFTTFPLDVTQADVRTNYFPDGLHPNAAGHEIIANLLIKELNKIEPLLSDEKVEEEPVDYGDMLIGNEFAEAWVDATNRVTVNKNIYLAAGQTITLKNPTTYKMAIAVQSSETVTGPAGYASVNWITQPFTTTNAGWYGLTFARNDNADFALGTTDPNTIDEYVTIE